MTMHFGVRKNSEITQRNRCFDILIAGAEEDDLALRVGAAWALFRSYLTLGGYPPLSKSPPTFEKSGRFWRVGTLLRSGGTFEKSPHSPKVPPVLRSRVGFGEWVYS